MKRQQSYRAIMSVAALLAASLLGACGSDDSSGNSQSGSEKPTIAAVSLAGNDNFAVYSRGFERAADELGLDVKVYNSPTRDTSAMTQTINSAVGTNPDYLIVPALDSTALRQPLLNANKRGVEIITYDSAVKDPDFVVTHVNSDYRQYGVLAAKALGGLIDGDGAKVQMLSVIPSSEDITLLENGFYDTLRAGLIALPTQYTQGENSKANEILRSLITREPDLRGVVAVTAAGLEGAVAALRAAGKTGKIKAVALSSGPSAISALRDGDVQAVIGDQLEGIGAGTVKAAYDHANGKKVGDIVNLPLCTLTAENVDDPESQRCLR